MANIYDYCVLSSRVRLARNLRRYPFSLDPLNAEIADLVAHTLRPLATFDLTRISEMDGVYADYLKDRSIISPFLARNLQTGAVLISSDKTLSIMINEEDHLREQCFLDGFALKEAYDNLRYIDRKLAERMTFAVDEDFGYITACMTNLGTGMRASAMLFLPALSRKGRMPQLIAEMKELGLTVRGASGEGSAASGCVYQVSNEVTLGYSEDEIIKIVSFAVTKLCELECIERDALYEADPVGMQDECFRAYGILTHCRRLSYKEFSSLFVSLALGGYYGTVRVGFDVLSELFIRVRPDALKFNEGALTAVERDEARARIACSMLK